MGRNQQLDARFERLVTDLGEQVGRLPGTVPSRGRRYPSRADLLRAVLALLERNPVMRTDVYDEVRADGVRRVGPSAEVAEVAEQLQRLSPQVEHGGQDALADLASRLEYIAVTIYDDRADAATTLGAEAEQLERFAARHGGYELLRPLLVLGRRLRIVQDALDPAEKVTCPRCNQRVRIVETDGIAHAAQHNDQAGSGCSGGRPA